MAGDGKDMEICTVAMSFLVGADRHLRSVGMHGAVGEDEHHVGTAGAAFAPGFQLEGREIRNEVGLPHIAAGPYRHEFAFTAEMVGRALPLGKVILVVEDEAFVVEQVELQTEVVHGSQTRMLAAAGVEVLIAGVERQREQALWAPLETVLAAVAGLDRGAAVAGEHVHDLLVEMLLRGSLRAGLEIEHEHRDEVTTPLKVGDAAVNAETRPWTGRNLEKVDPKVLRDRHAFVVGPGDIGVE